MSGRWFKPFACTAAAIAFASLLLAQQGASPALARQFQAAAAAYHAGDFAGASAQLERLAVQLPESYEVHELLGLAYAAQSQDAKAVDHLSAAVRLKPDSAVARTNLAAGLSHQGKVDEAGKQFAKATALDPLSYDTNHNLGEYLVQAGKLTEACVYLAKAQQAKPEAYNNGYDLALAEFLTGQLSAARALVGDLAQRRDTGELHTLLGRIAEKDGKFVDAANEFATAAHMDPSEDNLFSWGTELLLHRTYDPAIDVFKQGSERYAGSARLRMGLGMALYFRGKYDDAIKSLLAATDLSPADARCYLFLSKAYDSSPAQAAEVTARLQRYAELQPGNALAQYYYAMSLWKGKRAEASTLDLQAVQSLLEKSIALDARIADAHLQLGILYASQHAYASALPQYQQALALNPDLPDAHYRLGQYYVHTGAKQQAQQEFDLYQQQRAQHQAAVDKERAEVEQFVYAAKAAPAGTP